MIRPPPMIFKIHRSLAPALLLLVACSQGNDWGGAGAPQVFPLGTDGAVEVVLDPKNKGFGSSPPNSLAVAFTMDELRGFFAPQAIPASRQLLDLLEGEERDMHKGEECNAYTGDSPISMILRASRDHAVLRVLEQRDRQGQYEFEDSPRPLYGLRNFGRVDYTGGGHWVSGSVLRLPGSHSFGFEMTCGLLDVPSEGGCIVHRDLHSKIEINYSFCEGLLPHWREIDRLYFEIATRIVKKPALTSSYRIEDK